MNNCPTLSRKPSRTSSLVRLLALSLGLSVAGMSPLGSHSASATNVYWDTNGATAGASAGATANGTWDAATTGNWSTDSTGSSATSTYATANGGSPATADVFFSAGTNATGGTNLTLSGAVTAKSITIEEGAVNITSATTTPSLTLGTGGLTIASTAAGASTWVNTLPTILAASQTWTNNLATGATNLFTVNGTITGAASTAVTFGIAGTGDFTLAGIIANGATGGTVALNKTGAGTLTLSGANTFTGGTTINAGTVSVANLINNGGLGATASGVTLNGGTLKTTNTSATTNTHAFTIGASGGTLNIAGTGGSQGGRVIFGTANTLLGSGALTITGNGTVNAAGGSGVLVLNAVNTGAGGYSGAITLQSGGLLEYGITGALATAATVTLGNNSEFTVDTGTTASNAITVSGGTSSTLSFTNGTTGIEAGTLTLNANAIIGLRNWYNNATVQSGTISGKITGTGGLTVNSGTGTGGVLTLSNAANDYSGGTTITQSVVVAGTSSALGSGTVSIGSASGAQLQLASGVNVGNALTINGGGVLAQGALYVATGNATYSGTINLTAVTAAGGHFATGGGVLTIAGNNTITTSAGIPLTVRTGTVLIAGAQNYTGGTTLANSGATIQFAKTSSMPASGTVALAAGTTLVVNAGGAGEFTGGSGAAGTVGGVATGTGGQGAPVTWASGATFGVDTTNAASTVTDSTNISTAGLNLSKLGAGTLALSGNITTGVGGVSVSGGTLTLGGTDTYTGATTVSNGATLNVTGAIGSGGGTAVTLSGANSAFSVTNTNGLTGTSSLTVGTGTTATLAAANNYSGATSVTGTLQLQNAGSVGSSAVTLNAGALLQLRADSNTTFTSAGVTVNGNSTVNVDRLVSGSGNKLTLGGNTLFNTNSTLSVTNGNSDVLRLNAVTTLSGLGIGDKTFNVASGANLEIGNITADTVNGAFRFTGAGTTLVDGNITQIRSNRGLSLTFDQTGVVTLSGSNNLRNNSNTGSDNNSVAVNSGTTNFNSAGAIGNSSGTIALNLNGGTIDNTSGNAIVLTGSHPISIAADFTYGGTNNLNLGNNATTLNGTAGARTITTNGSAILTLSGAIGNGTATGLTKAGAGTLALSGTNTYTGGTTINAGTLSVGADANLGNASGGVTIQTGGTLATTGNITTSRVITLGAAGGSSFTDFGQASAVINVKGGTTLELDGQVAGTGSSKLVVTSTGSGGNGVYYLNNTGSPANSTLGAIYLMGTGQAANGTTGAAQNNIILRTANSPQFGTTPLVYQDGGSVLISNQNGAFNGAVQIGTGGAVRETDAGHTVARTGTISNMASSSGGLTVQGDQTASGGGGDPSNSAGTMILGGTNTFGGSGNSVTIGKNFTLSISADANLGDSTNQLNIKGGILAIEDGVNESTTQITSPAAVPADAVMATFTLARQINLTNGGTINVSNTYNSAYDIGSVSSLNNRQATAGYYGSHTNTLTVSGKITGSGGLTVSGAGTVVLTNAANDYTGGTTILGGSSSSSLGGSSVGGTLSISSNSNLGNVANGVTIDQGGTLATTNNVSTSRVITLGSTVGGVNYADYGQATAAFNVGGGKTLELDGQLAGTSSTRLLVTSSGTGGNGLFYLNNTGSPANSTFGSLYLRGTSDTPSVDSNGAAINNTLLKTANLPQFGTTPLVIQDRGSVLISNQNGTFSGAVKIGTGGAVRETDASHTVFRTGAISNMNNATNFGGLTVQGDETNGIVNGDPSASAGTLGLGGINTFGGAGQYVTVGKNMTLSISQDANLGQGYIGQGSPTGTNGLKINGGILEIADGISTSGGVNTAVKADVTTNRSILLTGASTFSVLNTHNTQLNTTAGGSSNTNAQAFFDALLTSSNTDPTTDIAHNNTFTVNGVIADGTAVGSLTKTGPGTLALLGNNTYTGGTTLNEGITQINSSTSLGATSGGATINNATLEATQNITTTRNFTLGHASSTIQVDSGKTYTMNGVVSGSGGLTKTDAGTLVFSGGSANTFNGATTINGGTLNAATAGSLGSTTSVTVNSGGTLLLSGGAVDRVNNSAAINLDGGTIAIDPSKEGLAASIVSGTLSNDNGTANPLAASTVGLGALTLTASSTLDFDTTNGNLMVFASGFNPNGFTLAVNNWTNANFDGVNNSGLNTDDRLVFNQDMSSFFNSFNFNSAGAGVGVTQIALDGGFFEVGVSAVPEPATLFGAFALVGLIGYRERRRLPFTRAARGVARA